MLKSSTGSGTHSPAPRSGSPPVITSDLSNHHKSQAPTVIHPSDGPNLHSTHVSDSLLERKSSRQKTRSTREDPLSQDSCPSRLHVTSSKHIITQKPQCQPKWQPKSE